MDESMTEVHQACVRIGQNPVSHLGLANKELFHSNFLAWLAESEPAAATIALGSVLVPDSQRIEHKVMREHKHLDLIIQLPGHRPLVVENKTFAIPDLEQLRRYGAVPWVQANDPTCLLLSLGDPHWADRSITVDQRCWTWLSYTALADGLRSGLHAVRDDFALVLAKRYISLLDDLVLVCDAFTNPREDAPLLPAPRDLAPLRKTRLHDGVLKLRVRSVGADLRRQSRATLGNHLNRVGTGFTHGHPLLEMFAGDPERLLVGWQLQENQFRLAAIMPTLAGRTADLLSARSAAAKKFRDDGVWFDFTLADRILADVVVPVKKAKPDVNGFNKFNPDFVYAYRLTKDVTIGHLRRLNEAYTGLAARQDLSTALPSPDRDEV